jgi:outer membrane murein-binding lipoprotein Lpp
VKLDRDVEISNSSDVQMLREEIARLQQENQLLRSELRALKPPEV